MDSLIFRISGSQHALARKTFAVLSLRLDVATLKFGK